MPFAATICNHLHHHHHHHHHHPAPNQSQGSVDGIQGLLPLQVLATRGNHRSVVDDLSGTDQPKLDSRADTPLQNLPKKHSAFANTTLFIYFLCWNLGGSQFSDRSAVIRRAVASLAPRSLRSHTLGARSVSWKLRFFSICEKKTGAQVRSFPPAMFAGRVSWLVPKLRGPLQTRCGWVGSTRCVLEQDRPKTDKTETSRKSSRKSFPSPT